MSLGTKIRKARTKAGLTQENLARKLDVTTQTIYKIEKDKNVPSFELVKKIAKVLKISLDSL
ncbi:MAG: helix-turn-helix transcriptional regulator [Candidatus Margulisbacteria bacterium]|nr:helix-turn-helix transcriptional regulator [Candidatus Margulisiibacteriota bacterium]